MLSIRLAPATKTLQDAWASEGSSKALNALFGVKETRTVTSTRIQCRCREYFHYGIRLGINDSVITSSACALCMAQVTSPRMLAPSHMALLLLVAWRLIDSVQRHNLQLFTKRIGPLKEPLLLKSSVDESSRGPGLHHCPCVPSNLILQPCMQRDNMVPTVSHLPI